MIRHARQETWLSHDPVMADVGEQTRRLRDYGSLSLVSASLLSVSPSVHLVFLSITSEILLLLIECCATSFLPSSP